MDVMSALACRQILVIPITQVFLYIDISLPQVLLKLASDCGLPGSPAEILATTVISVSVLYLVW